MFYRPQEGHGLPHNPFSALIAPRPIGWISSRHDGQDNLAPYSFFNAVAYEPPQVMFASVGAKDSLSNIIASGVFAVNVVGLADRDAMNATSAPVGPDQDEFALASIDKAQCREIDCPYVAGAPGVLECRMTQTVRLTGADNHMVIGEVIGVHLRDDCVVDGHFDVTRFAPLARLGYQDYASVNEVFSLKRPG